MFTSRYHFSKVRLVLSGSIVLAIAMLGVNALNYTYTLILGRLLGPDQYGAYASFISLFLLISLLPLTLQQVAAKYAASRVAVSAYLLRLALGIGTVLGLLIAALALPMGHSLHLPASWLLLLGFLLPVYAVLGVLRGEAQGKQAFGMLGSNMLYEHLIKIILTPLALVIFVGAHAAVVATLAAFPLLLIQLRRFWSRQPLDGSTRSEIRRYAVPVFINLTAAAIFINSDVLLVNALLPSEAGLYAASAILGRALFYSTWVINLAVFPLVAARQSTSRAHEPLLRAALLAVAGICLSVTLVCLWYPDWVMGLFFGEAYMASSYLLAPYILMTSCYALAATVSNHYLALGRQLAGYLPLAFALLQLLVIAFFHSSSYGIIVQQLWIKGLLFVVLIYLLTIHKGE